MCELFGVCAAERFRVNNLLEAFFYHSNECRDGWGLAVFRGKGVSMEKEPVKALDSKYLMQRLTRDVTASNLFAHIRQATIGRIEYANCHPFIWDDESGRTWTMIHNGTIFSADRIMPFRDVQEGTTDSERLLLYIVSCMSGVYRETGREADGPRRMRMIDDIIVELAEGNKLNLMLYDGEYMYVHTNCKGTLHYLSEPGKTIFATKPVLLEGWEHLPLNQLLVYKDGEIVFRGTDHGHEFHPEDHDMTSIMAAFSEL